MTADRPVARLRSPAELLAAVPLLCGFVPTASLVAVCLAGARRRLVLTARVDLPALHDVDACADQLVPAVVAAGTTEVVLSVWSDDDGMLPHADLVEALSARCRDAGVEVVDALHVRNGSWRSYLCADERCCPPGGTSLAVSSPAVDLVAAAAVLDGRAVLPSRAALAATVGPPRGEEARLAGDRLARAAAGGQARGSALTSWRSALAVPPDPEAAAGLVVSLRDPALRDEVLTWVLDDADRLLALLLQLVRWAVPPYDAALCAVLAWTAHARGDGALANLALDRALASDPGCSLARLGRQALDAAVPPAEVRAVLAQCRTDLGGRQPGTGAA